jgi:histidinol phosphatase-like enzyme
MITKHNIVTKKSFLIGDRITDIQSGSAASIKNLFLIVNPKMLEVNENLSDQPLQITFTPLKELKEFLLVKELRDEN